MAADVDMVVEDALLPKELDETEEVAREGAKNYLCIPKLDRKTFDVVAAGDTVPTAV